MCGCGKTREQRLKERQERAAATLAHRQKLRDERAAREAAGVKPKAA